MRFFASWLACSASVSLVLGGELGTYNETVAWFKERVSATVPDVTSEVPATRTYFYVGGEYVTIGEAEYLSGQMYVEKLVPTTSNNSVEYPLVFMTGGSQTGTNWLNTPDGRRGWASYFLSQGYTIYITDQPQRGRSAWIPSDGTVSISNVTFVQHYFTSPEKFNTWPQAHLHTQFPGTGEPGDATFDAFFAAEVQQQTNATKVAQNNVRAFTALLDKIGAAVLLSHSQAGPYGWGVADARPDLVKAIIAIEPEGPPFENQIIGSGPARPWGLTTLPLTYEPAVTDPATELVKEVIPAPSSNFSECVLQAANSTIRTLPNLSQFPVLLYQSEASYHAYYDYCTYKYMVQTGMDVDYLHLAEVGIHGNSHFSFMELNNLQIAPLLSAWLRRVLG